MQLIGSCVLCSRNFGVVAEIKLDGFDEGKPRVSDDEVTLPVALGVVLLVTGGQLTRFRKSEVVELIKSGSGPNVREFLMSRTCPACWPSDPDESDDSYSFEDDEYQDENDDEYDGDDEYEDGADEMSEDEFDEEYDDDGEPIQRPVRALKVEASGRATVVMVKDTSDIARELQLERSAVDHSYLGQLGVYIYFDGHSAQKKLPLNSYLAVLGGGPVRGGVVVVTDISRQNLRTPLWQDLRNEWVDERLFEVIAIVNSDKSIRKKVSSLLNLTK
jgi:hypothetical protein